MSSSRPMLSHRLVTNGLHARRWPRLILVAVSALLLAALLPTGATSVAQANEADTMSVHEAYVTTFMQTLAGADVILNENLRAIFTRILARQLDEEAGQVNEGNAFEQLAKVFTFVASPPDNRPPGPVYDAATVDAARTAANAAIATTTGSLQVTLEPAEAVAAGAQWRRVNTDSWFDSEEIETNIPIGGQTVQFRDIGDDWEAPSNAGITISAGEIATLTRTYRLVDDATPPAAAYPLNDTGIDWCADGRNNNLDCSETAFDYPGQDGDYGRDALAREGRLDKVGAGHAGFDFTKLDANGDPLSIQDAAWSDDGLEIDGTRWSCVRDNHTGLIWEVKTDDGGLHDRGDRYNWYNTDPATNGGFEGFANADGAICDGYDGSDPGTYCNTQAYVSRVNAQGLCGASDWRLPSVDELLSIVSNDRFDPAIDTDYFSNTVASWFWSSSPSAGGSKNRAWSVYFINGNVTNYYKGVASYVRLVRAGQ